MAAVRWTRTCARASSRPRPAGWGSRAEFTTRCGGPFAGRSAYPAGPGRARPSPRCRVQARRATVLCSSMRSGRSRSPCSPRSSKGSSGTTSSRRGARPPVRYPPLNAFKPAASPPPAPGCHADPTAPTGSAKRWGARARALCNGRATRLGRSSAVSDRFPLSADEVMVFELRSAAVTAVGWSTSAAAPVGAGS